MTHTCVSKLTTIGSDNGLSPGWSQAFIWANAWILLIELLGTKLSEILIEIHIFSFQKMHLKCCLRNGSRFVSASMWRSLPKHHHIRAWRINSNGRILMYLYSFNYLSIWFTIFSIKYAKQLVKFVDGTKKNSVGRSVQIYLADVISGVDSVLICFA